MLQGYNNNYDRAKEENSSGMDTALTVSLAIVSVLLLLALGLSLIYIYLCMTT